MMTADDIAWHLQWRVATGHPGGYRIVRQDYRPGQDPHLQELTNTRGYPVLFKNRANAERRAARMNIET